MGWIHILTTFLTLGLQTQKPGFLVRYFPGPQKDTKQTESHTSGGMTGRLGICKII